MHYASILHKEAHLSTHATEYKGTVIMYVWAYTIYKQISTPTYKWQSTQNEQLYRETNLATKPVSHSLIGGIKMQVMEA
jgi:hypothetical protein